MNAREIVEALGGRWDERKRQGRCKCPAHDDHDPSLDVAEKNGKAVFICRAGCPQESVIEGLRASGLWERPSAPKASPSRSNGGPPPSSEASRNSDTLEHPTLGKPESVFEYYDPTGKIVGAVCRWDTDKGKEIRPALRENGGWRWTAFPDPRPLYRLPDITTHTNKPVLVVEGEKAADCAAELITSHIVTTWPSGTGAVGKADLSPLKGRDVVLWPDNDDAGRKAMRAIADRLTDARSVSGVKLPEGLPKGWDLADAIPADLDPVALVGRAVNVLKDRLTELPIKKATEIDAADYPEPKWAVPGLVPSGCTILAGPKSRGKSFIALDLALAVASSGPALGNIECEAGGALYLALEDGESRIKGRQRAILQGRPVPEALDIACEWRTVDNGGLDDIRAWIAARPNARLIIVDVLAKVKGSPDRDRGVYDQDYATIGPFHALAREKGIAIVLVHHTNKTGASDPVLRISGTMGLSGAADTTLVLSREAREMNGTLDVRGRDVPEAEIALQFDRDTGCVTQLGAADDFRKSEQRREIIRLLTDAVDPMLPVEIAEALGRKRGTVRMMLSKMRKDGEIERLRNGKYYMVAT